MGHAEACSRPTPTPPTGHPAHAQHSPLPPHLPLFHPQQHNNYTIRPQYAFADEVALVEVAYARDGDDADRPLVRAFAKAPAGPKGFGPVSIGFIADKAWEF